MQSRNRVDALSNCGTDHERVEHSSADVCKLYVQLFPVGVEEAALDRVADSIERDDLVRCEKRVEEKTDDPAYGVLG